MFLFYLLLHALGAALITEYTTIRDVVKWKDCKNITAAEINTFLDPFHCRGLKAECLKQFNLSELNGACKDHLMPSEVKKLPYQKFRELIETDNMANIACFTNNLLDFVNYYDPYPPTYSYYCSHDEAWRIQFVEVINRLVEWSKKDAPAVMMDFLRQHENIPQLGPEFLSDMSVGSRNAIPGWVISLLTKEQFGYLSISKWTPDKIKAVPPEFMEYFKSASSIPYWPLVTLNSLTIEQISNWGKSPSKLPPKGRFARRTFYVSHPCTYLKTILDRFQDDDVVKAVEDRCKTLWRQRDFVKADIRQKNYRRWYKNEFKRS